MITIRITIVGLRNDSVATLMLQVNHKPKYRCLSNLCRHEKEVV